MRRVAAKDLKPGDVTAGSGVTIVRVVHRGLSIPSGKVEVTYTKNGGEARSAHWGARTLIGVLDAPVPPEGV